MVLADLELDGATIVKAVGATFERRGTAVPAAPPIGLTAAFASDRDKIAQWSAFARRLRIQSPPTLLAVVERIAKFAMPVFVAIITNTAHQARWTSIDWTS